MKANFTILLGIVMVVSGCLKNGGLVTEQAPQINLSGSSGSTKVSKYLTGDPSDVTKSTTGGTCLMGGGTDVDAAFKWMIQKSGGGDFVVIRFDNSNGYNSYIYNMGSVNSVETVVIASITDQHYTQRGREGRLVTFMARMNKDLGKDAHGIAVDEQTAVCVEGNGIAKVFGINKAFFLQINNMGPETCTSGSPLTWNRDTQAIKVYRIPGLAAGNGSFDLNNYSTATAGEWGYYYVNNGIFFPFRLM